MNWESELTDKNLQVEYRWVAVHKGVEGNEKADQQATKVAYKLCGRKVKTQNPLKQLDYVSFAHIGRNITEMKCEDSRKKTQEMAMKSKHSYRYDKVKRGGNSMAMNS
jgi:ribonuclease HI